MIERFADDERDVDINPAAVGGICSRKSLKGIRILNISRVWISRELEARVWAESVAEVWENRRGQGREGGV
jgi:hypothetical protein